MKHLTMADKSLLVGDEAADTLMEYAALIAQTGGGDSVSLRAIGTDGAEVEATFLLNSGTVVISETTPSVVPEPDNRVAVAEMRKRIDGFDFSAKKITNDNPFTES